MVTFVTSHHNCMFEWVFYMNYGATFPDVLLVSLPLQPVVTSSLPPVAGILQAWCCALDASRTLNEEMQVFMRVHVQGG